MSSNGLNPHSLLLLPFFLVVPIYANLHDLYYNGFQTTHNNNNNNLTLNGSAKITTNNILQLTNTSHNCTGHAFYSSPFAFKSKPGHPVSTFTTTFAFSIVPQFPELGGHGFAFVVSPSTSPPGALPMMYLGLFNDSNNGDPSNHLFAVEFDTFQNTNFLDINNNHVGVDINSLVSNYSTSASYFDNTSSIKALNLSGGDTIFAWIEYHSPTNLLNVTISPIPTKPTLPIISFKVDLSSVFNDHMYVGFSASTGLLSSSHYIFGWSFKLDGIAKDLDPSSLPSLQKSKRISIPLVSGITAAALVAALLAAYISHQLVTKEEVIEEWEHDIGPHRFTYKELKQATNGFREKELIGVGGFGRVYKGTLRKTNTEVAVKRISHDSRQGVREFMSEISSIGRLRHRNLVQLLGWCRRSNDFLLVYDFMQNGSLDRRLFNNGGTVLSWSQRFKILKGAAAGLLYLHEGWEKTVIHRDVKAGNVLLDSDLNVRLGDFGLAKLYEHGTNPGTTRVVGTLGYLAPELTRTGKPTVASDVYAFGALVLEVVCGRRPVEPELNGEEMVLTEWVWGKWEEGKVLEVVDVKMGGEYEEEEVVVAVKIGIMCSHGKAGMRPCMREVVSYLEGEVVAPTDLIAPDTSMVVGKKGGMGVEEEESFATSSFFEKVNLWSTADYGASSSSHSFL